MTCEARTKVDGMDAMDRINELEHSQKALVGSVVRLKGQIRRLEGLNEELQRTAGRAAKERSWGWVCELLGGLATVIAVAGVLLNNARVIWCFPVWMASNGLTLALHVRRRMWTLAARDAIFLGLAAAGWWMWTR